MTQQTNNAAVEFSTLMLLSPVVMASRMTEFWMTAAAPTARSKREASRMITEKVQAAGESAIAVSMAVADLAMKTLTAAMIGTVRSTRNDADDILTAALKPYARRVTANRDRLSP